METLRIVIVGHVDHGKSTLVGRLVHDTGSLPVGRKEAIEAMCQKRGMPFEWAFVMDALQAERDQGITIDTSQIRFKAKDREVVIIDAPGHKEFLKNMVTGAASADAAVLVVDALEGVQEQTRRHGYLLHLLGVRQVTVVINKMDLVDWQASRYQALSKEVRGYLTSIGVQAAGVAVIPVSARDGDNMASRSTNTAWYDGPTLTESLDTFASPKQPGDLPLRFPVQDVYKFDHRRIIAGRIESGRVNVGDKVLFSPSNKFARVSSIESFNSKQPVLAAFAGQSVGITLDEQIFVERGQIISHEENPPVETNVFRARLFWLGREALAVGRRYKLKLGNAEHQVEVQAVERVIDVNDLSSGNANRVERNAVGEVILRSRSMMALDEFADNARTGRFVVVDGYDIAGGGIISMEGYPDQRQATTMRSTNVTVAEHHVSLESRWRSAGHKSGVLWLTGLSGSGKTTLALGLERLLFAKGYLVYVLDGDNVRHGLSTDLGFSPQDRAENIRRIGEVARLFAESGFIVITSFISPYQADRDRVRKIGGSHFHEVFIDASLEECEKRDPKGLYKKARAGEIPEFTGISAPYEAPGRPELHINTAGHTPEENLNQLMEYIERSFALSTLQRHVPRGTLAV